MVFFLNSKVKTHTEDALKYIFDEKKEKNVILGYSIVSRRSPLEGCGFLRCVQCPKTLNLSYQKQYSEIFLIFSP